MKKFENYEKIEIVKTVLHWGSEKQTSEEQNHLNNKLFLVRYSNGSPVFRPPFGYQSGVQMVV